MKFENALHIVHSQAGRKAIARNTLFGSIAGLRALVAQFEGMTKSVSVLTERGYTERAEAIRNSTRYVALEKRIDEAAKRAQGIYAIASASFDLTPEFEPGVPRHLSQEQLAQIAEFSGMPVQKVIEIRTASAERKYRTEMEAMSMTEALFWAAEADEDPEVKAETVLKALQQTVQFIATWSSPDFAELGILRHDIEMMETVAAKEMDLEERAGALGVNEEGTGRTSTYQREEEVAE